MAQRLKGIEERRERPWLISWIKNSQKVIESGDEYAVALYEKYKKVAMPAYPFTDAEIISVLEYIDVASKVVPQVAAVVAAGEENGAGGSNEGMSNTFHVCHTHRVYFRSGSYLGRSGFDHLTFDQIHRNNQ